MKNLILVRHGKSSWEYNVKDKDRPLKERGINDAFLVAEVLRKQQLNIDYVFSSPANRALHTSMIFCRELKHDFSNFQISNELYDFSGKSVHSFVKTVDNNLNTIVIFGHNYAFTHIANSLGNNYIENVPTSGLVHLQFNEDKWSSVTKGITKQVIFPKQLRV